MKQFGLRHFAIFAALLTLAAASPAAGPLDPKPLNERDRRAREINHLLGQLYDADSAPALRVLGAAPADAAAGADPAQPAAAPEFNPVATGWEPRESGTIDRAQSSEESVSSANDTTAVQPRLLVRRPAHTAPRSTGPRVDQPGPAWAADEPSTGSRVLSAVLAEIQSRAAPLFDLNDFSSPMPPAVPELGRMGDLAAGASASGPDGAHPVVPVSLLEQGPPGAGGALSGAPNGARTTDPAVAGSLGPATALPAVRVNRASAADLAHGLHVDAVRAAKIVEFRAIYGDFSNPEDLAQVAGITNTMTVSWARAGLLAFD